MLIQGHTCSKISPEFRPLLNNFTDSSKKFIFVLPTALIMTSLEQLSIAEFSGEKARPKIYENGHTKVKFGIEGQI